MLWLRIYRNMHKYMYQKKKAISFFGFGPPVTVANGVFPVVVWFSWFEQKYKMMW